MLCCGRRCFAVGIVLSVAVGIFLYPLTQWDASTSMDTRISALLLDHLQPRLKFNLCSLVGLLTSRTEAEASRVLLGSIGALAVLDSVRTEDMHIAGVPVRLYRPAHIGRDEVLPVLIYYHGGGFVTGSIDSHNSVGLHFCSESSMAVVSVGYRLAPEHVYPAAFEDSFAVTKAVVSDPDVAARLAINSSLVSIGGDSAGGNLAAGISLYMGRTDLPPLRSQVSIYPAVTFVFGDRVAMSQNSPHSGFNMAQMIYYRSNYLGGASGPRDLAPLFAVKSPDLLPLSTWRDASERIAGNAEVDITVPPTDQYPLADKMLNDSLVPLMAKDLGKTPPTVLILAGIDPLVVDGRLYGQRLQEDGVKVELHEYAKQLHGFAAVPPTDLEVRGNRVRYPGKPEALDCIKRAARFVVAHNQ